MKTKCLLVDDEPLARNLMRSHLQKLGNFEIVEECGNAMKALQALHEHQIDLMFIDIQMPQITGIEFVKTLKNKPKVIFTTAHSEYAVEGFELDVVDFLLKPITFERFLKSVNKYFQVAGNQIPEQVPEVSHSTPEDEFIYVKENKKIVKVHLKNILYIEGLSEYVQIYTTHKKLITKSSMTNMEEKLPDKTFLRIHKSFIVSLPKVEAFTPASVEINGKELPIGRSYKTAVLDALYSDGAVSAC